MSIVSRVLTPSLLVLAMSMPAMAQDAPGWIDQGDDWPERKAELQAYGEQFDTAWDLYQSFVEAAGEPTVLTHADLADPAYNWSGIYTRTSGGLNFDPDQGDGELTAQLTPEGQAVVDRKRRQLEETGGEYDPISDCRAPGMPRWITEPFLKEAVVTPDQTWLINEMVNDVRRVYTDGRDHTAPEDAYPTWNGDTIGFWDDEVLVTHTTYLRSGQYQRGVQPDYSEEVEVVERWKRVDDRNIAFDVWVYDPVHLAEPWYTRQGWTELTNDDHFLRIRYWDCGENPNNDIIITDEGTSQFPDFDWLEDDAAISNDPAVRAAAEAAAAAAEAEEAEEGSESP